MSKRNTVTKNHAKSQAITKFNDEEPSQYKKILRLAQDAAKALDQVKESKSDALKRANKANPIIAQVPKAQKEQLDIPSLTGRAIQKPRNTALDPACCEVQFMFNHLPLRSQEMIQGFVAGITSLNLRLVFGKDADDMPALRVEQFVSRLFEEAPSDEDAEEKSDDDEDENAAGAFLMGKGAARPHLRFLVYTRAEKSYVVDAASLLHRVTCQLLRIAHDKIETFVYALSDVGTLGRLGGNVPAPLHSLIFRTSLNPSDMPKITHVSPSLMDLANSTLAMFRRVDKINDEAHEAQPDRLALQAASQMLDDEMPSPIAKAAPRKAVPRKGRTKQLKRKYMELEAEDEKKPVAATASKKPRRGHEHVKSLAEAFADASDVNSSDDSDFDSRVAEAEEDDDESSSSSSSGMSQDH